MAILANERFKALPERLTISFWIWGFMCGKPGNVYHDLDRRMLELKERGFNCIRMDSGAGFCHDLSGRRMGVVELLDPFPGYSQLIRQMSVTTGGGRFDVMEAILALFEAARRHGIYVILSSWYYLHTYWFASAAHDEQWKKLSYEERYMAFAKLLGYIIDELAARGLDSQLAFSEIFNEVDGLPPMGYGCKDRALQAQQRDYHEKALAFLQEKYPGHLFAFDTCTPYVPAELFPRNMQIWNAHRYYIWSRSYNLFEQDLLSGRQTDPENSESLAKIRRFLKTPMIPLSEIAASRADRAPTGLDWTRRVWLYSNLAEAALPELEAMLSKQLAADVAVYKAQVDDWAQCFIKQRETVVGDVPLVMGEAASYCAANSMRWEEESDAYWEIIEYAILTLKKLGFWGCTMRTTSAPEDPSWTEYPERLRHLNELFLAPEANM